jgi:hypothetical protein
MKLKAMAARQLLTRVLDSKTDRAGALRDHSTTRATNAANHRTMLREKGKEG